MDGTVPISAAFNEVVEDRILVAIVGWRSIHRRTT